MLFPIRSRPTRTLTVAFGNSGAGNGWPAIALGSGMFTWALASLAPIKNAKFKIKNRARLIASLRSSCRTLRRRRFRSRTLRTLSHSVHRSHPVHPAHFVHLAHPDRERAVSLFRE